MVTGDIMNYTNAKIFSKIGKKTHFPAPRGEQVTRVS